MSRKYKLAYVSPRTLDLHWILLEEVNRGQKYITLKFLKISPKDKGFPWRSGKTKKISLEKFRSWLRSGKLKKVN